MVVSKESVAILSPFRYGWCHSDTKPGTDLDGREIDFINDLPYQDVVQTMLDKLGLPLPPENKIFRGSGHDLLFLDSHGLVIRIGHTSIPDMINPAALQPLGWLESHDKDVRHLVSKVPLTVAIYPGIETYKPFVANPSQTPDPLFPFNMKKLYNYFKNTGQKTGDIYEVNCGIIRVLDDTGQERRITVLLDIDDFRNGTHQISCGAGLAGMKKDFRNILQKKAGTDADVSDALLHCLTTLFNHQSATPLYLKAVMAHQPLRKLFWSAVDTPDLARAKINPAGLAHFWQACAKALNTRRTMTLPVWRVEQTAGFRKRFVREDITEPVILYRPWTNNPADRLVRSHAAEQLQKVQNRKRDLTR